MTAPHVGMCTRIAGGTRRGVRSNPLNRLIRLGIRAVLTDTTSIPIETAPGVIGLRQTPDALLPANREKLKAQVQ